MLKISVSAIAQIKSHFTLFIYNDNPDVKLDRRDIRRIGYRGKLHIINGEQNIGLRQARLKILAAAKIYEPSAEWIIYVDDDDILLNIDIPDVTSNVFAVIQNGIMINTRIADLMMAVTHPDKIVPDDIHISIARPHIGLRGTAVRTKYMTELTNLINDDTDARLREIDESLEYRAPVDLMLWMSLNTLMRRRHPEYVPIFMDSINYIQNNIDFGAVKYGRAGVAAKNHAAHLSRALDRYERVMLAAIAES